MAIVGGGCGAITAAFELTRPEHEGRYEVTVYQVGWRLGGKGASGRGPADRIEEHGLHIWLGFYENAFRVMRDCYAELGRDPATSPIAHWRDAFFPDPLVGVADRSRDGRWLRWLAHFPPAEGDPGDPLEARSNPFSVSSYMVRTVQVLRALVVGVQLRERAADEASARGGGTEPAAATAAVADAVMRIVRSAPLVTMAALLEAIRLLETLIGSASRAEANQLLGLVDAVAAGVRGMIDRLAETDDELRRTWEVVDLTLAVLRGTVRFGLMADPRGFDAINDYDCREWLLLNGASRRSVDSALVRGLYDLALAYEEGDPKRPGLAAGQAIRGALRMFFTYRGALFWKMRAGMGDVVFAPLYEVLVRRGVTFRFFHRLESVRLAAPAELAPGERPYVKALDFDVQAEVAGGGAYRPLVDVRGLPCWPSRPDFSQLVDGERLEREGWEMESWWDRRRAATRTLRVVEDFDFVVVGVGGGAVPHVCRELVERDARWRAMAENVRTVATQAFQVWMREDVEDLGWREGAVNLAGFAKPFDTWADMRHLVPQESWGRDLRAIAYFCGVLPCGEVAPDRSLTSHPSAQRDIVRRHAIDHLERNVGTLWPRAVRASGGFRWEVLLDPARAGESSEPGAAVDASAFDSQFWTANVNPSDRYVLALPGTMKYRISPLDNTFDNLTIAGDWTDAGFNEGCVETAVMSGRLAAHALSGLPRLQDIIGYDHP